MLAFRITVLPSDLLNYSYTVENLPRQLILGKLKKL